MTKNNTEDKKIKAPVWNTDAPSTIEFPFLKEISYEIGCNRDVGNDLFVEGEDVVISEKLDGVFAGYVWMPSAVSGKRFFCFSKESGKNGLSFLAARSNKNNIISKIAIETQLEARLKGMANETTDTSPFIVMGEIFGKGIKERAYGCEPTFRIFDICTFNFGRVDYFDYADMALISARHGLLIAPAISISGYSRAKISHSTRGQETHSKKFLHSREGVVIRPLIERVKAGFGRVLTKSVPVDCLAASPRAAVAPPLWVPCDPHEHQPMPSEYGYST